jgi:hypothetical protein|tara:strand:+ start:3800 stop:4087 length:288 start_codon:yes stop_codon:yes gene_type:complete
MAKAKAKAKTTPIDVPAKAPVEVPAPAAAPAPAPTPAAKSSSTKKVEVFRAAFETDVDHHIDNFVAERNISSYKVTEVIGHVEAADNYWQKTIEY